MDEAVDALKRSYLRMDPLASIIQKCRDTQLLSDDVGQERFVSEVIECDIARAHPPSSWYTTNLLKILLLEAEMLGRTYGDTFQGAFDSHMLRYRKYDPQAAYHKTMFITARGSGEEEAPLTVRVDEHRNELGWRVWSAGYLLADFILNSSETSAVAPGSRDQKKVAALELGCGIGLPSIVGSRFGSYCSIVATDHTVSVLENLKMNLALNGVTHMREDGSTGGARVEWLDWELTGLDEIERRFGPSGFAGGIASSSAEDFRLEIWCSDCVYDEALTESFVKVLDLLLRLWGRRAHAIVACTKRSDSTFEHFLDLAQKSLDVQSLDIMDESQFPRFFDYERGNMHLRGSTKKLSGWR